MIPESHPESPLRIVVDAISRENSIVAALRPMRERMAMNKSSCAQGSKELRVRILSDEWSQKNVEVSSALRVFDADERKAELLRLDEEAAWLIEWILNRIGINQEGLASEILCREGRFPALKAYSALLRLAMWANIPKFTGNQEVSFLTC